MLLPGFELEVDLAALPWRSTKSPGVRWIPLRTEEGGEGTARDASVLIQMDPGCGYPAHRHIGREEVLVLQGAYTDAQGLHAAGKYVCYEAQSSHAPVALGDPGLAIGPGNPACLLFAVARGGIELLE